MQGQEMEESQVALIQKKQSQIATGQLSQFLNVY
jgi:hypothetical protein